MTDFEKGMQAGMDIMAKFADGIIDAAMFQHKSGGVYAPSGLLEITDKIQELIKAHREDLRHTEQLTPAQLAPL